MTHRRSPLIAALVGFTLLISACTDGLDTGGGDPDGGSGGGNTATTNLSSGDIILTGLQTVDSCDALLSRLIAEGTERVGPYGFDDGYYRFGFGEEMAVDDAADEMAATSAMAESGDVDAASAGVGGGGEFSSTNVQEGGVDEADRVKTDGERLVTATNGYLHIVDVTGSRPRLTKRVALPEDTWEGELFLVGDSALLMAHGWSEHTFAAESSDMAWYPGGPTTRIVEIDMNEGTIERTLEFEGSYLSAREIDGSIRIVLTASANRFNFLYPSNEGATDQAEKANRDVVADSTIDHWIPTYRITEGSGGSRAKVVEEGPIVDCDRVHLPDQFAGFGSVVVLTADVDNGLSINDSLSVFTNGNTVYASTDRLVVATPRWPEFDPETGEPVDDEVYRTALHTFDITDPDSAAYTASGTVIGTLLSQYSLSEYEGYLRVATTDGSPWDSRGSESFVTVLSEEDGRLETVGQVGGLGKGETIFAVRFLGNKGYVVTFEQIDPLYVVDLADPTDPTVEGELKIPGFSSYLHPIGDDLLLGVGTDGDDEGNLSGAVVSLFDVSDPTDPRRVDKLPLGPSDITDEERLRGDFHSYSSVAHDPRAFTYWDDTALIPVGWWYWNPDKGEDQGATVELVTVEGDKLNLIGSVGAAKNRECEGEVYAEDEVYPDEEMDEEPEPAVDDAPDAEDPATEGTDAEGGDDAFARPDDGDDEPVTETMPAPAPMPDQFCWSWQPEIYRTVIVDDLLYSVTYEGIAVHEFNSLRSIDWIPFEYR